MIRALSQEGQIRSGLCRRKGRLDQGSVAGRGG